MNVCGLEILESGFPDIGYCWFETVELQIKDNVMWDFWNCLDGVQAD